MKNQPERIIDRQYVTRAVRNAAGNVSYTVINVISHSALSDLTADDHLHYLLASDAGGRTSFAVKWLDLTDGLETTLHTHDSRYFTKSELQATGTAGIHWTNISKVGSNLNEIQTRSHTVLSDIGTKSHAVIDSHIDATDIHVAHSLIDIVAGNGLTGGGAISGDVTLTLGTPSALSASTTNAVTATSHTHSILANVAASGLSVASTGAIGVSTALARADHIHAITTSSNPGAAASILASDAAGKLTLVGLTLTELTASRLVATNGTDVLTSVSSLTSWIAGTTNRVTITDDGDGTVTLTGPQDINTAATPTFAGLTVPWLRPAADSTTAIRFQTLGGTTVATVDTSNQRFGIGVTPSYKLHAQTSTNGYVAGFTSIGSGDTHGFYVAINDLNGTAVDNNVVFHSSGTNSGGFIFAAGNTERMRLTSAGKLGIGMTPTYDIDVTGDIRLSGVLYVDTSGTVDFGTNYIQEATDFELRGSKALSLFQTIKASGWNITTTGVATFADVITPSIRAGTSTELVIAAGADIQLNPTSTTVKLASGKLIRSSSFTSGFAGGGWQIDDGVLTASKVSAEFDNLTIRGRLSVYELLIRQIRATNGSVFISSTGKAKTVAGGPTSFTITTDNADVHGFLVGDLIRAQRFTGTGVYQSDLQVTSVTNAYTFVATKIAGDNPTAGMEFVRLGSTSDDSRRGSVYLTADDSGAPFIDIVDGITSHSAWNSRTADAGVKARIGRITGITGTANEYGIWVGSGTGNTAQNLIASNNGVTLNNVPLRFKAGSSTVVMQLDPGASNSSPSFAMGSTLPTAPLTGSGLWMGKDGSDYEFRVGTISAGALTKGVHWDGSKLNIVGSLMVGPGMGFTVPSAVMHLKFDSPRNAPLQVSLTGHSGQEATVVSGNVVGEAGKFNGSVRLRPASISNYINNPSWEVDTSYWTMYSGATYERVTTDAVFGSACAKITTGATSNPYLYCGNVLGGPAHSIGQVWTLSAYVKAANASGIGKTLTARLREDGDNAKETFSSVTLTGTWQRISVTRTLTTDATNLNHYFRFTSMGGSNDAYFIDAVQLELNPDASPYIDGSLSGCAWAGTAHNSVSTQSAVSRFTYPASVIPTVGTMMMWVKPVKTSGTYNTIVRHDGTSGFLILRILQSGSTLAGYWGSQNVSIGGVVNWNEWNHFAVTRDDTTTRIYANGVMVASSSSGTSLVVNPAGTLGFSYTSDSACGWIDDFVLSSEVLTDDDIKQVYQSNLPVNCPTSPFEFVLADGTAANIVGSSTGIFATNTSGAESFALVNTSKTWGTLYSGGNTLASGDLVLGDPDQFHLFYDASASSLTIGKPSEEHIVLDSTGIKIKNGTTPYITLDGGNATFTGTITSTSGSIGGWTIGGTTLTGGAATLSNTGVLTLGTSNNVLVASAADADYRLWIGHATAASAPFSVAKNGGFTSTLGLIGGWAITSSAIQSGDTVLSNTGKIKLGTILGMAVIDSAHADWRLWIGQAADIETNPTSAQFRVSKTGLLTASGVNITGAITAESGSITGNFSIGVNGKLFSGLANTWQSSGYQLEYNGGVPRMYIGDGGVTTGDKYLMWDGTNLSFRGTNTSLTTGGTFTATNVDITGIINASSGTITGNLTIGTGGKIVTTNADIDADGFLVRTGTAWNSNDGYRVNSGTTTYGGLWSTFTNATDAEMRLQINKRPDSATYALDRNIYMVVGTTAPQAKTSKMWLRSTTINVSGVEQKVAEVITVASSAGSTIDINAETVKINNQVAWHAGNFTPGNYSLTTHNHTGVYALASHTHTFGDISGNGDISTTGKITVDSDGTQVHTIGKAKFGIASVDTMYLAHFDHLSTTNYALAQTSNGTTVLNSPTGQSTRLAVNNTTVLAVSSAAIEAQKAIHFKAGDSVPQTSIASGTIAIYMKGNKLVIARGFTDGGGANSDYWYLDISSTGAWTFSSTEP